MRLFISLQKSVIKSKLKIVICKYLHHLSNTIPGSHGFPFFVINSSLTEKKFRFEIENHACNELICPMHFSFNIVLPYFHGILSKLIRITPGLRKLLFTCSSRAHDVITLFSYLPRTKVLFAGSIDLNHAASVLVMFLVSSNKNEC